MPTYLADILAAHRARAAQERRPLTELVQRAAGTPAPRDFTGALRVDGLSCVAEIKRRSPSKGALSPGLQPRGELTPGGRAPLDLGDAAEPIAAEGAGEIPRRWRQRSALEQVRKGPIVRRGACPVGGEDVRQVGGHDASA